MTRKAILFSALTPSTSIPREEPDTEAWDRFLRSDTGGAWSEQEISCLINSDRERILTAVRDAKESDYSLLVFVGCGEFRKGERPWPEAHVLLSDGSSLSERDLNSGTPRCTLVFDWSSGTHPQPSPVGKDAEQVRATFRALFDEELQKAEGGLVKIYAGQVDAAGNRGLSFSGLLIHTAQEWAKKNHGILSLQQANSLVIEAFPKSNSTLKAEYQGGRRLHHFPFAVNI